jgi:hypothetical protein
MSRSAIAVPRLCATCTDGYCDFGIFREGVHNPRDDATATTTAALGSGRATATAANDKEADVREVGWHGPRRGFRMVGEDNGRLVAVGAEARDGVAPFGMTLQRRDAGNQSYGAKYGDKSKCSGRFLHGLSFNKAAQVLGMQKL